MDWRKMGKNLIQTVFVPTTGPKTNSWTKKKTGEEKPREITRKKTTKKKGKREDHMWAWVPKVGERGRSFSVEKKKKTRGKKKIPILRFKGKSFERRARRLFGKPRPPHPQGKGGGAPESSE